MSPATPPMLGLLLAMVSFAGGASLAQRLYPAVRAPPPPPPCA